MINLSTIRIKLGYKLLDSKEWKSIDFLPESYFDLEPDEIMNLDSNPFYNHAIEYLVEDLEVQKESVMATKVHLYDESTKQERLITESFWNYGHNRLIERQDIGDQPYSEIILEMLVSEVPEVWEVLRCDRLSGALSPSYHAKIQDCEDGSQVEQHVSLMIGNALDDPNDVNPEDLAATYEVLPDVHLAIPDGLASNRKSTKSTFPTLQEFEFEVATIEFEEAFAKQVQTDPEPFVAEIPSIQLYPFLYQVAKIRVTESKETKGILGIGAKSKQKKIEIVKSPREGRQFVEQIAEDLMLEMVYVPSGDFVMGAPDKEEGSYADERPQHLVTVSAFLMGKYPITQAQYESVMGKNPSRFKDKPDSPSRPVENVSWEDAQEFCKKLSELSGREYHLPSEAQWEYACRAMPSPPISRNEKEIIYPPFHFGETILTKVANYNGDKIYGRGEKGESQGETTAVDHFGVANEFGLCDMHGNVWEWCEDDWHSNYDGAPTDGSAWIDAKSKESNKTSHPRRGGSSIGDPEDCRSAFRDTYVLDFRNYTFGFRVISFAPGLT